MSIRYPGAFWGAIFLISTSCGKIPPSVQPPTQPGNIPGTGFGVTISIPQGAMSQGIRAFGENPRNLSAGTTVTWVNEDVLDHTVVSNTGQFASNTLTRGQSYSHTFNDAGSFPYHCSIHPAMVGEIRVTSSSAIAPIVTPSPIPTRTIQ